MARCPSFKTSMRCAILTPPKSSNAERWVSILFKLGLQQRARIVEPVAPGLVRIEFSFRTLVASKHPDGPDAIERISFDSPVGLNRALDIPGPKPSPCW